MRALFHSRNLIGDALNISPAWRQWLTLNYNVNWEILMSTLPDHVAPLYQGMVRDICPIKTVFNRPEGEFDFEFNFDVNEAFRLSDVHKQHITKSYAQMLGVDIGDDRKLTYIPEGQLLGSVGEGVILISMFSASCESRDANTPGLPPNKMIDKEKWKPMLRELKGRYPTAHIRFLGAPSDVLSEDLKEFGEAMFGIPLNRLALIMQKAKLLVTIDNGMSHMGAAQETPMFEMYPACLGPHYILPIGNPNLEWMHMNPAYVNPAHLLHNLKRALTKFESTIWRKDATVNV